MIGGEGSTYGKYFLIKRLAVGGMGEIFLAKLRGPVGFKKLLAVKRILSHHAANDQFVNMFFAEARVTAQLSHPHIVQIYEMGEIEGSYYLAMEYVAGKPMRDVIDRARKLGEAVPPAHAATVIADLCNALSFAHNAKGPSGTDLQVIHRDVNPANLLVSYSGDLKLIDFGIAKSEHSNDRTDAGTIKGKFVYMSPEQSSAQPLDKRSDIFSVGICLYETLTGANPFVKSNAVLSMDAIQRLELPPLSQSNRKLAPFEPIMAKALAKKREERYNDCNDLAEALQSLLRSGTVETPPTSLADYMNDLFEQQIASEGRIIANALETTQTDILASGGFADNLRRTTPTKADRGMRQLHDDEAANIGGAQRNSPFPNGIRDRRNSGRRLSIEAGLEPSSRFPFYIALALIVMVTIVGSVWVTRRTINHRRALAHAETARRMAEARKENVRFADPKVQRIVDKARATVEQRNEPTPPVIGSEVSPIRVVQVVTEPLLSITRGGKGTSVELFDSGGDFVMGTGASADLDPFALAVHYAISENAVSYTLESEPWAQIMCNNAPLGRSPQTIKTSSESVACELSNPNGRKLKVTLRRTR
ncbi:MAG: serine/threonine protein kinase [Clostridia bacterium]|nr:serine/threonine protein kinase [Deltaproteobacteria bacterium]